MISPFFFLAPVSIALFFDVFKRRIPNSVTLVVFSFALVFGWINQVYDVVFFAKAFIALVFIYWMTFLGVFNAAYGKLFLVCTLFAIIVDREYLFFANFFFLVFFYLIVNALLFYGVFFLRKENRNALKHHYEMKTLAGEGFRYTGILLNISMLSIYASFSLEPLRIIISSFMGRYSEAVDVRITLLLLFSFFIFFLSKSVFGLFSKYRSIHPLGIAALLVIVFLTIQKYSSAPLSGNSIITVVSLVGFWMGLRLFLSGYVDICHKKLINYTELTPGTMIDRAFLRKRFGIDLERSTLEEEDVKMLKKTIVKATSQNPLLGQDVLAIKRFLLTPFMFFALMSVLLDINFFRILLSLIS